MFDRDALVEIIQRMEDHADLLADAILVLMQSQGFRRVDATVIWRALRDSKANSDLVRAAEVERALLAITGPSERAASLLRAETPLLLERTASDQALDVRRNGDRIVRRLSAKCTIDCTKAPRPRPAATK